jgi:predicted nucleic acid-binding protein
VEYVLDANILFSSLMSGKSLHKLLFQRFTFYTPDFVFLELRAYETVILQKTKLDPAQLRAYSTAIFSRLTVLPSLVIGEEAKSKAVALCKNIDEKDIPYVALAIELNLTLLTADKKLVEGLRKKKFKDIILFQDFIKDIG